MATQQERVQNAVEQAWTNLENEGINPVLATSDQAINSLDEYVESEPSANELKAFKKEWLKRQTAQPDTEEAEAAEEMEAVDELANAVESANGSNGSQRGKLEALRKAAVEVARQKLGEEADDAPYMKAYMTLADEPEDSEAGQFYLAAQESPRQLGEFGREFQATQPKRQQSSAGKPLADARGFTTTLAELRQLMSQIRYNKDPEDVRKKLDEIRNRISTIEGKISE